MSLWKKIKAEMDTYRSDQNSAMIRAAQQQLANKINQDMYNSTSNSWISKAGYSGALGGALGGPISMRHVTVPDESHIPPGCVQVSMSGVDIWIDYNTGHIYSTSAGITEEERKRMGELEEERKRATKQAKLDIFKKMPAIIRQDVVNTFIWEDAVSKMDALQVEKSEEQIQLENKDAFGPFGRAGCSGQFGHITSGANMSDYIMTRGGLRMPKDFTAEELMRAHNEATLEEELLGNTDPK